jgi:lactate dehydrogenase-like 2-hydroxyacid dehydrogenase
MFRGRNMPFHVYRPYPFREKVSPSIRNDLRRLGVRFERRLGSRTDAILSLVTLKVDSALMKRAPRLRVVANVAVGYDNVDVPEATRRGIVVTNTPDVLTEATADLAWALILAAARRVVEGDRFVRAGRFTRWDFEGFRGADLHGKTLGILGAGRIGQAVGRRATGFSMKVLYAGRSRRRGFERRVGARRVGLRALLRGSDFVSIHVPLTPETRGMIGGRELRLLRPTAILVNTSRGPVVDERALAQALRSGRLAAAGLDVYEREPEVHPALLGLENVTLLPHIGSSTDATRRAMLEIALRNLAAALRGRVPPNALNPGALARRARRT